MSDLAFLMSALLAFFIASPTGPGNSQTTPKGTLVERVTCANDTSQSYALYLPTGYSAEKKWPIIYCFDPEALGRVPVENFKDAAEEHGYIVAGSNNSQNGPASVARSAIVAMWEDTHSRFNIDDNRIYATGFSGGARVAFGFGYAFEGKVAGVIACGAGFPSNISPTRSTPFAVFATVGVEDFNYPELVRLSKTLDGLGIPNRLRCFEGRHQWAPKALCTESIAWMQLQAMKSGKLDRDAAFIDGMLANGKATASSYESSAKPYEAYLSYEALAADFRGLRDVTELEKKAGELRNSKEVKQAIKQERDQLDRQAAKEKELHGLKAVILGRSTRGEEGQSGSIELRGDSGINRAAQSDERGMALADLKKAIADLRKKAAEETPSPDRTMSRRVMQGFFVECYEAGQGHARLKNFSLAAANLEIAAEIRPDRPMILYRLACAYSGNRQKGKALEALRKAVEKGFSDVHALESDASLDGIRSEPGFRHIVEELKKRSHS